MSAPVGSLAAHALQLENLLKKERALLLSGEARQAAELNADKLALLDLLDPVETAGVLSEPMPPNLGAIQRLARENVVLLAASLNGLRSALSRLRRVEHDASVGTYGRSGAPLPFDSLTGGYQRKL